MKKNILLYTLLFATMTFITSCKKDKNVYADDFTITIPENPEDSLLLGTVTASTEKSFITYTLLSESVSGAFSINASSGRLYVEDESKFNFEINPVITAKIEASNGKNDAISNVTVTLTDVYEVPANIGDFRDGGVVFWVNPIDNTKGMVCAVSDQANSSANWGCFSLTDPIVIDGADGISIGTGYQNTLDIVAGCPSAGTAADLCASLSLNGHDDWFLPSRDEISEIYTNIFKVDSSCTANGGSNFDTDVLYWTSSEFNADKAYDFYFSSGVSQAILKLNVFSARAVRSF